VDDVARLIEAMQAAGYKAWTIRTVLTPARRVFDFASRRLGWSGRNPVRLLDRSERPRSDAKPRRILTSEELSALLDATGSYRLLFEVAANTGARLSEVLGLTWGSIDFAAGTVTITQQLDRHGQLVELKTKRSRRTIELSSGLVMALRAHKLASEHSAPGDFVFTNRRGRPHDQRNIGGRVLARAIKRAKIAKPAPTFHSLRHTFASAWIASGGNVVELSAILGHTSPAVTAGVYAHEFDKASRSDERRSRIERMYGPGGLTDGVTGEVSGARSSTAAEVSEPTDLRTKAAERGGAR
jgi:integrase